MKKLIKIAAVAALLLTATVTYAQQKFGYVNSQEIFFKMPEIAGIQTKLQTKSKQYETQLNTMYTQYENLVVDIQNNGSTWMQAVLEAKYKEVTDLEARIVKAEEDAQQDIIDYEATLLAPVEERAYQAIQQVAAANGYGYIIDSSMGVFIVLPEGDNLTKMVKAQLGI